VKKQNTLHLTGVYLLIIILTGLIVVKLVHLQIFSFSDFKKMADRQHTAVVEFAGRRGEIRDVKGVILAKSLASYSLYAVPDKIKDKGLVADKIAQALSLPPLWVEQKLSQDTSFVWIKRRLNKYQRDTLKDMNLDNIGFIQEPRRIYPQKNLFSHLVGMVNIDEKGLEGVELYRNEYLKPSKGKVVVLKDSRGRILPLYQELIPFRDGFDVILTADSSIQYWAEFFLKTAVEELKAKGGSVVVMDPNSGRIHALCNYPDFDPNRVAEYSQDSRRNRAVTDFYEPGSVFKVVTLVAALAEKPELVDETFFCEQGVYKIPGSILHDWKKFGNLKFEEVFENSSNIGVAKIAGLLGEDKLYEYIIKLGFGRPTGIDVLGETGGIVKPVSSWSRTSQYVIPMGHEVCVSILQLVKAFAIVANGGYQISPYLVEKIIDKNNVILKEPVSGKGSRVISSEVAAKAKRILYQVVEQGTGRRAKIEGLKIAGKTGTAQKIDPRGGYSKKDYYASFIGFFPVDNPEYVIGVAIDEPRKSYYGGMVAAPLFRQIAEKILEYKGLKE
jgi:cell division protein FtsI (penicillin-binding protein 3)